MREQDTAFFIECIEGDLASVQILFAAGEGICIVQKLI